MNTTARIYNCACCHKQTLICTYCDRGNIYCSLNCAKQSRVLNHRQSNARYQKTFFGRQKHAARQGRYRLRKINSPCEIKKVTDQGSIKIQPDDLLCAQNNMNKKTMLESPHCHFCRKCVSPYLRNGYLRYHARDQNHKLLRINDTG